MKKFLILIILVLMVFTFSACALLAPLGGKARYSSEKDYTDGKFNGVATSKEMNRIIENKRRQYWANTKADLEIAKLNSQTPETKIVNGVPQGFKVVIVNLSSLRINVTFLNPDSEMGITPAHFLDPFEVWVDYFLPGTYTAISTIGNEEVGRSKMYIGVNQYKTHGLKVHGYLYLDPCYGSNTGTIYLQNTSIPVQCKNADLLLGPLTAKKTK